MTPTAKSQQTREKLLEAAQAEFSEFGLAGARVDRIAERSGVNKQRIYAYFGNKEMLFSAVMAKVYQHMGSLVPIPTTEEGLRSYVGDVFDYHRTHGDLVSLLAWEGLHYRDQPIPDEKERETYYVRKTVALSMALGIDDPTEAARILLELVGLSSWPFIVPQQRRLMLGPGHDSEASWSLLRASIIRHGEAIIDSVIGERSGV
ncbi:MULTISPECIES: TetR/AcrR family transcriptional regulator [unclassified Streptomyces]|uniref:TetR/AcrR family transcriptional regulator n=1 Tax=unclassified Streptomyces TaxID=2593676 RepID=UPI000DC600A8|nr:MULTISPECIES: TetR/AcrR family transcriptional regulator [unclassified Streptomyces]MYT74257.1 TetR family transcriptional regulator [Streptomyces sp. SID8367]RAJ69328.1 TetR family transcriptional regulator [Streptomyces sp. PsTaAH-137]